MTRETLKSVVDVTTQLTNLLGRASLDEELKKLGPKDVLIVPPFDRGLQLDQLRAHAAKRSRPATTR